MENTRMENVKKEERKTDLKLEVRRVKQVRTGVKGGRLISTSW
jgi:hypothetical protein